MLPITLVLTATLLTAGAVLGKPPNVVFIIADDLGVMDTTPYNPKSFYETRNPERFAASATRFTNACTACPAGSDP